MIATLDFEELIRESIFFREHCQEALSDVFMGQARLAIENKDYSRAESYLLRANRADIILQCYKDLGMWHDALRIAKDYIPSNLAQSQVILNFVY